MKKKTIKRREYMGFVYIMPWLIGFLIFQLYPLAASFFYSFTDFSITNQPSFIGIKNYMEMFLEDTMFFKSIGTTLKYVVISVPLKLTTALLVAVALSQKIKGINLYRTIYYIPSIFGGSVAISILWRFLFMDGGLINRALQMIHLPSVAWLSSPSTALLTLSLLSVWQFGSSMILFLAAIKQVPVELYEAARIDGGNAVHNFFSITLPMISPVFFFNLLMQMVNAFQDFTGAFVITGGGPVKSTYLFALKLYDEAFSYYKMGYACALSWILFAMILVFTVFFFRFSEAFTYYEDGGDF